MAEIVGYFPATLAVDVATRTPLRDVQAQVYAVTDTTFSTPLAITDMTDVPFTGNTLMANGDGIYPDFKVVGSVPQVIVKAGQALTPMTSVAAWAGAAVDAATSATRDAGIASTAAASVVDAWDLYALAAETRALIGRMSVRPNADRRNAIDTLIRGLKDNGIWAKLDALYLLAAHTSQAGLLNWKGAVANLVGVNSPAFTVDRGFKLDGASNYLEASASYYQALSGHDEALSVWVTSRVANDSMTDLSASLASINVRNSTSQAAWRANSTPVRGTSFVEGVPGLFQIAREDANTTKLYKDGALQDTFSTAGGSTNPGATVPFRLGVNTSKAQFSSGTYVMAAYGSNLTLLQSSVLYNLLRDYMLKVGVL